jgi:hypothetical protein
MYCGAAVAGNPTDGAATAMRLNSANADASTRRELVKLASPPGDGSGQCRTRRAEYT